MMLRRRRTGVTAIVDDHPDVARRNSVREIDRRRFRAVKKGASEFAASEKVDAPNRLSPKGVPTTGALLFVYPDVRILSFRAAIMSERTTDDGDDDDKGQRLADAILSGNIRAEPDKTTLPVLQSSVSQR